MVGAVKKGHFDIHYRETSQYPIGECLSQTFFHRRDIFARYGSTFDGVHKLETFTRLIRLHLEPDMTILSPPARLLDKLAFDLHLFFYFFALVCVHLQQPADPFFSSLYRVINRIAGTHHS